MEFNNFAAMRRHRRWQASSLIETPKLPTIVFILLLESQYCGESSVSRGNVIIPARTPSQLPTPKLPPANVGPAAKKGFRKIKQQIACPLLYAMYEYLANVRGLDLYPGAGTTQAHQTLIMSYQRGEQKFLEGSAIVSV